MFESKKTLIVVYKDELLVNQLKKMVETSDDKNQEVVGTKDKSVSIVSWTEKVWLENKKAGNIQGKILFLGDIKGTDKLIPVLDIKFDDCGVKYGWAGNQAVLFAEPKYLTRKEDYVDFLEKLSDLPIPEFLKTDTEEFIETMSKAGITQDEQEPERNNDLEEATDGAKRKSNHIKSAQDKALSGVKSIGKFRDRIMEKSEEMFRNKSLMKRQMLFYGIVNLYNDGLEKFINL